MEIRTYRGTQGNAEYANSMHGDREQQAKEERVDIHIDGRGKTCVCARSAIEVIERWNIGCA